MPACAGAYTVLTHAPLVHGITRFQRGLPRDIAELARPLCPEDDSLPQIAAQQRDLRLLQRLWRYTQEQPAYTSQQPKLRFAGVWLAAVRGGDVKIAAWIDTLPCRPRRVLSPQVWARTIQSRSVAMIEYVLTRFPGLKTRVKKEDITMAITCDVPDVLEWFEANIPNLEWPRNPEHVAAVAGAVNILRLLHERVPTQVWPTSVMDRAARVGSLETVRFLHEVRTDGSATAAMDGAAATGHLTVVQFLHTHRSEGCTPTAMNEAATNGHLDVVQFLHTHRSEGCTTKAMGGAAANNHLNVVQFLHDHRTEGCTGAAIDKAATRRHVGIV